MGKELYGGWYIWQENAPRDHFALKMKGKPKQARGKKSKYSEKISDGRPYAH